MKTQYIAVAVASAISFVAWADDMFPFVPSYDAPDNVVNMSHILEAPAGKNGRIRVKDGHFVNDKGRVRLNATNLTGPANFPTHEEAERLAARLARFGINCVRLHYFDDEYGSFMLPKEQGILSRKTKSKRALDPERRDRMDYLVSEFKKRGIYVNVNLHVARKLGEADGIPNGPNKGFNQFYPPLIALQKEYAKELLSHVNPYTGMSYLKDPAVAVVELNNEEALWRLYRKGGLDERDDVYGKCIKKLWSDWLVKKYGTTEKACDAWKLAENPLPYLDKFRIENGNYPLVRSKKSLAPVGMKRDFHQFISDVEHDYWTGMRDYLRNDLGLEAPIASTQLEYTTPFLLAEMDYVDSHSYWCHPSVHAKWKIGNKAMVNNYASCITSLAAQRVEGKPYTVSEYNHPYPNFYGAEGQPMLRAYGALHGWDGVFEYSYNNRQNAEPDHNEYFFSMAARTDVLAHMPACAAMFLRGDVKESTAHYVANLPYNKYFDRFVNYGLIAQGIESATDGQVSQKHSLVCSTAVDLSGMAKVADIVPPGKEQKVFKSDTGEIVLNGEVDGAGVWTVNTQNTKVFSGFPKGRKFDLGGVKIDVGETKLGWTTISLVSHGATGFGEGGRRARILLAATGLCHNGGAKFTHEGTFVHCRGEDWGNGKTVNEGIAAAITMPSKASSTKCWALDERGERKEEVPVEADADGLATIRIDPKYKTVWYEIATGAGAKEIWQDPTRFAVNRLPARSIMVPCESPEVALAIAKGERPRTESKWLQSLNGAWGFKWKHNIDAADWEKTAEIAVPGCWQLQGEYDPALYTNSVYPIHGWNEGDPMTEPPKEYTSYYFRNPVGLYSRMFTVPADWKGRRVVIHFGGVSSAMYLYVNGKEVGYSQDSRLPAEFDITPYLKDAANLLEVKVLKHCDGSFIEDQDFWRFSGIFRDVWLVAEAEKSPRDLVVDASLSDDFKTGTLVVRDENGKAVLEKKFENPKLWSCETPNMYYETVEIGRDTYAIAFGFRKIEIKDAVLYINGKRALFMGTNRHEMEPETGYTVTLEGMKKDIEIFHDLNINAVRTSHYPNDPTWYELCDREGIYVVCEANVEAHGVKNYYSSKGEHLPKNPIYHDQIVSRGVNMVKVFRNHPSIIFWSMGNESGDGPAMKDEYDAMKAIDSTRPIQYEPAQNSDHSDIKCPMYSRPWTVEKYVKNEPKKPVILCEYSHAMGNSNGDIQDYWDLVRKYPSMQGGFIWDFADQAVWKTDKRGKWLAYGGDFGDKPNFDNFNCNGFVTADRDYHPAAYEIKHAHQPVHVDAWDWKTKTVKIWNAYRFLTLDHLNARWVVKKGGKIVKEGILDTRGLEPDTVGEFKIDAPDGDAITFVFERGDLDRNKDGHPDVVATDQFAKPFAPVDAPEAKVVQDDPGAKLFKLNFWRAPTDNDRGWKVTKYCKAWKDATKTQQLPNGCTADFKVGKVSDGKYLVSLKVVVGENLPPVPRIGVTFKLPKEFRNVEWYGLGPWENYSDRCTSAQLDVWRATIGLVSGLAGKDGRIDYPARRLNPDNYIEPGEQGYRTGCRWIEFSDGNGKVIRITALNAPVGFNAWPYSQASLEKARHQWDLSDEGEITVNVDVAQMGVGGDNSWGWRPHADDMIKKGEYVLSFLVEGL